jgi:anti-sigma regulatory factor (Ser/Thr protein kinase)
MACGLGGGSELIEHLRGALADFTGAGWEQEDDVTFVTVQRLATASKLLASFKVASAPDNEREAMEKVAEAIAALGLPADRLDRLKTAVAEATMNAMEHGNQYDPDKPVEIEMRTEQDCLIVAITDEGGEKALPQTEAPDLDAKLEELQSPRGWGLFLIKSMVDETRVRADSGRHTMELVMRLADSGGAATPARAAVTEGGAR